jgi:HEPN domain-containing protein
MDVAEAYYVQLGSDFQDQFQQEMNRILREENVAWRMSDGEVFKLDSEFLDAEVLARTEELLKENAYEGALDEFREARNELTAGDTREAIAKAQAAFESTMKTILGCSSGNASQLVRKLRDKGFFDDLPEETRAAFGEQVIMTLPTIGNRLGRHGQGADVVEVPRHYAELAVHLAGSFIRYLVERELEIHPPPEPAPPEAAPAEPDFGPSDDDIPF